MEAVVFDMDGIIFDSENLWLRCWAILEKEYGLKDTREAVLRCTGTTKAVTREIMMDYYGEGFDYEKFAGLSSELFHKIEKEEGLPLKPGVFELLDWLKEKKIKLALASSTRIVVVEDQLKTAGLYDYFDVVIGGDMLEKSKPEPDIYILACEKLGVKTKESYAIEDSFNGIRSAYSAGMKPIMVPDLKQPDDEMKEKSFRIATSLNELVGTLDF